jgi:hypothetical protein
VAAGDPGDIGEAGSRGAVEAPVRRDPKELRKEWRAAQVATRDAPPPERSLAKRLMVPSAVLCAVLIGALAFVIYATANKDVGLSAAAGVPIAVAVYVALGIAAFVFSYGYRDGDKRAALKLTALIVTGATLVAGIAFVVAMLLDSDSSKSSKDRKDERAAVDHSRTTSNREDVLDEAVGVNFLLDTGPGGSAKAPAAGWYADPWAKARMRYWDGAGWTGYTN